MTGFSKVEVKEKGFKVGVELKSLNGRYLEISCRLPKSLNHKEFEARELIKKGIHRGNIFLSVQIEFDGEEKAESFNFDNAKIIYNDLKKLKTKLKITNSVNMDNLLQFSNAFYQKNNDDNSELEWSVTKKALIKAVKSLDQMRRNEGRQIANDLQKRMKKIANVIEKVDTMGIDKIPKERERLRMRVAQLFESDEIDEHRLQMELVLLADKLDISEECVRMRSHIKFFFENIKTNKAEPVGKKINFLLQEMNREVNTIGSKCNDAEIAQTVVYLKEELERIREQIQNIE